jgi:hypothetical protein
MHVNAEEVNFIMQQRKVSMSIPDRVATVVLAAALVIAVIAIAVVRPNTALLGATVAAAEGAHRMPPAKEAAPRAAPRSHAAYFLAPIMAPELHFRSQARRSGS